ncbi:MAG: site-specific integrase [Alphaproteobacteria bacterium]
MAIATFHKRLTDRYLMAIKAPQSGQDEHFDELLSNFAVRIGKTGVKSFVVFYRVHGRLRRLTLGRVGVMKLSEAREEAREALKQAASGNDPAVIRSTTTEADAVSRVVGRFITEYAKKRRSWRETERIFDCYVLPAVTGADPRPWCNRSIHDIAQRDVIDLLGALDSTPYMKNRVLAATRKFFNWCAAQAIITAVPVFRGLTEPEHSRDRVLTEAEISALWEATPDYPFGTAVRFLLLTGARRSEVLGLRWAEINLEDRLWVIPADRAKNGVRHELPLSDLALEILNQLPRFEGDYAFSTTDGEKPISGLGKTKVRLDKAFDAEEPWRVHDIRRTVGTGLQRLHIPADVIAAVLNHKRTGVTEIYMRPDYGPEKVSALTAWGKKLDAIINDVPGKVVSLHG